MEKIKIEMYEAKTEWAEKQILHTGNRSAYTKNIFGYAVNIGGIVKVFKTNSGAEKYLTDLGYNWIFEEDKKGNLKEAYYRKIRLSEGEHMLENHYIKKGI